MASLQFALAFRENRMHMWNYLYDLAWDELSTYQSSIQIVSCGGEGAWRGEIQRGFSGVVVSLPLRLQYESSRQVISFKFPKPDKNLSIPLGILSFPSMRTSISYTFPSPASYCPCPPGYFLQAWEQAQEGEPTYCYHCPWLNLTPSAATASAGVRQKQLG